MRVKTEFQIYEKAHRSGRVSYLVNAGVVSGKRHLPPFETREEAEHYRAQLLERRALESPAALSDLTTLAAANVRAALERLKPYEASITEAVDFFIKFAKPAKGKVSIQEAMDAFEKDGKRRGLSDAYLKKSAVFFAQFRSAFGNCLMNEVNARQAKDYVYGNKVWGAASKNSHIRHLRALYSATIKAGHATLNPFKDVAFVKETGNSAGSKVLAVNDAEKLLDFALEKGRKAECATLALVLFCGVRMEETGRVTWEEISLDSEKPRVRVEKAKNNQRRVNDVPTNALHWLRFCKAKGRVAPENFDKAMQRLRQKAKVPYKQNAARHSFASYHVALHDDAAKTAVLLGHPNPTLLYNTYRECVAREEADRFFKLVPKAIREQQQQEKERRDSEALAAKRTILQRLKSKRGASGSGH